MIRTGYLATFAAAVFTLTACANAPAPAAGYEPVQPAVPATPHAQAASYPEDAVAHGRYLVELLGCGNCHTDGALVGEPNPERLLAGSRVGIATSDPMTVRKPGVVYPSNLTPDEETGIGGWTLEQIVTMMQSGVNRHGSQALPVMPWVSYARLQTVDANAIAMYLKSLPPVEHRVPSNVRQGKRARAPYVHFGVYRSQP